MKFIVQTSKGKFDFAEVAFKNFLCIKVIYKCQLRFINVFIQNNKTIETFF